MFSRSIEISWLVRFKIGIIRIDEVINIEKNHSWKISRDIPKHFRPPGGNSIYEYTSQRPLSRSLILNCVSGRDRRVNRLFLTRNRVLKTFSFPLLFRGLLLRIPSSVGQTKLRSKTSISMYAHCSGKSQIDSLRNFF